MKRELRKQMQELIALSFDTEDANDVKEAAQDAETKISDDRAVAQAIPSKTDL